jgi:hypothetical protein
MISPARSRQPARQPWTLERLQRERAIAIGASLDHSSVSVYNSHFQSYLTFCKMHNFSTEPTTDTLSFYTVYMCHHIKPSSVDSYLSGICSSLEPFFPNVRTLRRSTIVSRTLAGMKKLRGEGALRRPPLTDAGLRKVLQVLDYDGSAHDDKLVLAIIFVGYHALMRLGELTWPDKHNLQQWRKLSLRNSVQRPSPTHISFSLPFHKADRFYEGNTILLETRRDDLDPVRLFNSYLRSRDSLFPRRPALWLRSNGSIPRYSWMRKKIGQLFGSDYAGHSLRSGGATRLAELGVPDDRIQAMGRWSSEAFRIYIRKHPVLLQALVHQAMT